MTLSESIYMIRSNPSSRSSIMLTHIATVQIKVVVQKLETPLRVLRFRIKEKSC